MSVKKISYYNLFFLKFLLPAQVASSYYIYHYLGRHVIGPKFDTWFPFSICFAQSKIFPITIH